MEKYREKKQELHMVFVLKKFSYNLLKLCGWVLERKCISVALFNNTEDMYNGVVTSLRWRGKSILNCLS